MSPTPSAPNLATLIACVRALADFAPDFVYKRPQPAGDTPLHEHDKCANDADATGSGPGHGCIIGRALRAAGVPEALLREHRSAGIGAFYRLAWPSFGIYDPANALQLEWLGRVQSGQDSNVPWANAVKHADMLIPLTTQPNVVTP